MKINYGLVDSAYKHIKYKRISDENLKKDLKITVAKEEKFAFQILLSSEEEFFCTVDRSNSISWKGLINRIRAELVVPEELKNNFNLSLVGYVKDDDGSILSDPIIKEKGILVEPRIFQAIWIEGKVSPNFKEKNFEVKINLYYQKGYEDEELIETISVGTDVRDVCLKPLKDSDFYLDLWQHLSNWARMYKVPEWSEDHWNIIENYIEELASLGEKVITAVVSDFPWAGQACTRFSENASNLFEYNIIIVKKDKEGNFKYYYNNLDKYIEICMRHGIKQEIDLFGLVSNWDAVAFGNPLDDYKDPIRISYYDEKSSSFKYMKSREELKKYIEALFNHLNEKGHWDKVRVISDEPNNAELFYEYIEFINACCKFDNVTYKSAVNNSKFIDEHSTNFNDISLHLPVAVKKLKDIDNIRKSIESTNSTLTWFVCCTPDLPNNFIGSPLIESRIIGWLTYYFGLDGFLRWDYAIWPNDPWKNPSYKFPLWRAGDMFFVYPGGDMKPVSSLRWENLRFGLQDYQLFKLAEEKGITRDEIKNIILKALGKAETIKVTESNNLVMEYSLEYEVYEELKSNILDLIENC